MIGNTEVYVFLWFTRDKADVVVQDLDVFEGLEDCLAFASNRFGLDEALQDLDEFQDYVAENNIKADIFCEFLVPDSSEVSEGFGK